MLDRWSEHPVRPVPVRCPASVAMAVVTLLIAIAARLTPLSSLLASGSARAFDFQVWRPLVFSLTTSSVISAVLTGLLLVLIGYQIEPMIGSVQFAFLYLLCGVGGSAAISLAGVLYSFEGSMCGLFGLMAASAVVKYVQKQDIRADIVLLTMFIIWAIVVGSIHGSLTSVRSLWEPFLAGHGCRPGGRHTCASWGRAWRSWLSASSLSL